MQEQIRNETPREKRIVEQVWDYTKHAKFYEFRPNYAPNTIDMLIKLANSNGAETLKVADIGAGTGNLSIMLLERGCEVISVEPNDAMREIGVERTKGAKIQWVRATGIDSTLASESFDWVTFGSSFNVMDRLEALKEAHRLLKSKSYFSCMWNHRDLEDEIQQIAESVILEYVPHYTRGVRREEQRSFIQKHKELFDNIIYIEEDFYFHQSLENYLNAWKSVK
ncbi:MAG: class I SAM-dependent methyltransferase, partial [Helicobacter sp.]|nr:class I SAM-dependent methyltransferase [Helicobacter sp.]